MDKNKDVYDFSGWATKSGVKCTDGRTIGENAFSENDGSKVPLVWQHLHDQPENILGHAILENRKEGVYAYCKFNSSPSAKTAKELVVHGDIASLSIFANGLAQKANLVTHGTIREVSLVLSGANPGAVIDNLTIAHGDGINETVNEEAIIYPGDSGIALFEKSAAPVEKKDTEVKHADTTEDSETIGDIFETLTEKQKTAVYAIIGDAVANKKDEDMSEVKQSAMNGDSTMKSNVFDSSTVAPKTGTQKKLTPAQFQEIVEDAKKTGSLRASVLAHAGTYGIDNIGYLFPDAVALTPTPDIYGRDMGWVDGVINGAKHSRFSRIKTLAANLTVETARALGYVTGALKKEEVFGLLTRTTTPTTIYKKQKLDRDDIVDITDMDVVSWLKGEMRVMLNEEIARAVLIGDGRDAESEDKISETCIRPIWTDDTFYSHKVELANTVTDPMDVVDAIITARKEYRGSGSPTMYIAPTVLVEILLVRDTMGRRMYRNSSELASELMVSSIVEVPLMEGLHRTLGSGETEREVDLLCIIANMRDYTIGADQGGEINFFQDFDIDYNQQKYLLETRMSGALTKPKCALVVERVQVGN